MDPRIAARGLLGEATTAEVEGALVRGPVVALLPLGSTEAHGPHLPLATDVVIAVEVARRAVPRLAARGVAALVLPAIPYAVTEFVGDFKGTISVRAETIARLIEDVATSTLRQGFAAVVLVNGHLEPEHARMLKDVVRDLEATGVGRVLFPDQRRPPTVGRLGSEFGQGGGHAGGYETSLVIAARPDLVREDLRRALPSLPVDLAERLRAGATRAREIGGERAYFGRPAEATPEEGERLLDVLAEMVEEATVAGLASPGDAGGAGGGGTAG